MVSLDLIVITLDIFCTFLLLMVLINHLITKEKDRGTHFLFLAILILQLLGLSTEILAYQFAYNNNLILLKIDYFLLYAYWYGLLSLYIHYAILVFNVDPVESRILIWTVDFINLLGVILSFINLFTGFIFTLQDGKLIPGSLYYIEKVLPLFVVTISAMMMLMNSNAGWKFKISMLAYAFFPVIAITFEYFFNFLTLRYFGTTFAIVIIYLNVHTKVEKMNIKKENDLTQKRIAIMTSQLQPHFLYNTLSAIMMVCDTKPGDVKGLIGDFSKYLRVNLDSLKHQNPIPFEKEMEQVKRYLKFEKLRFEEKITVETDITVSDFLIPSISVQPLVENAVRHGICPKENGGIIKIFTKELENSYIIEVSDNGVGFDVQDLKISEDSSDLAGIENVRNRLSSMVNGDLQITSERGKGTTAKIIIPRRRI